LPERNKYSFSDSRQFEVLTESTALDEVMTFPIIDQTWAEFNRNEQEIATTRWCVTELLDP
jgi:hypothetical protein